MSEPSAAFPAAPPTNGHAAIQSEPPPLRPRIAFSEDQIRLLHRTLMPEATTDEVTIFLEVCRSKNLDPFARQIHPQKRWNGDKQRNDYTPYVGIDGFRLIAERTGRYEGQDGPYWCGPDGAWQDVWTLSAPPVAAKIGIYKRGFRAPLYTVAKYAEYVQTKKDGNPNSMWAKMPTNQLAKCAESLGLRKAFPEELSGLYTPDEMGQADNPPPAVAAPQPVHAPSPVVTMPTPPPAAHPQSDVRSTDTAAAPKIEDKRKALSIEVRESLGLSPTADTNVATAVAKVYRGYIGAPKTGKLPEAQANDLNHWHECLIGLRDGIKGQLITKDDLQKDAYSVGEQLRKVVDAAPEEESDAAEPPEPAAAPVDVTDEMLQQRWGTPTLKGANWMANLLQKGNLPARDEAELAAFRRLAFHTKMVGLAISPKFTLAQVVKGVEATIGKTLTADPALTANMEVALTQVVNGLNGVVTQ